MKHVLLLPLSQADEQELSPSYSLGQHATVQCRGDPDEYPQSSQLLPAVAAVRGGARSGRSSSDFCMG